MILPNGRDGTGRSEEVGAGRGLVIGQSVASDDHRSLGRVTARDMVSHQAAPSCHRNMGDFSIKFDHMFAITATRIRMF